MSSLEKLIIIPQKEKTNQKKFLQRISSNRDCLNALTDFYSNSSYHIRKEIDNLDDEIFYINKLGFVIVRAADDLSSIKFYLPMVISEEQYEYLHYYILRKQEYKRVEASYLRQNGTMLEMGKTTDINRLMLIINKKNSLYSEKGMEKGYVRKKI